MLSTSTFASILEYLHAENTWIFEGKWKSGIWKNLSQDNKQNKEAHGKDFDWQVHPWIWAVGNGNSMVPYNCWLWVTHPLQLDAYVVVVVVIEGLDSFQLLTSSVQHTPVCKLNNIWYNNGLNLWWNSTLKWLLLIRQILNKTRGCVRVKRDGRTLPSLIIRLILKNVTTSKN